MEEQEWRLARLVQPKRVLHQAESDKGEVNQVGDSGNMVEGEDSEEEGSLAEQCFYASFKIYLGPSELGGDSEGNGQREGELLFFLSFFRNIIDETCIP
jgi:hypothetical protein